MEDNHLALNSFASDNTVYTKSYYKLYQLAIMPCYSFFKLVINLLMAPGMERVGEVYSTLIAFATLWSNMPLL